MQTRSIDRPVGLDRLVRRRLLLAAGALGLLAWTGARAAAPAATLVEVWKGPSCGCCKDWIKHLEANGFQVKAHDTGNTDARARLGVPLQYGSCHTAQVGGYAVEGHVPSSDIRRLLKERPNAIGIAVPGMPIGSPGMDGPEHGPRRDPYDVLLVRKDGSATPFQTYR